MNNDALVSFVLFVVEMFILGKYERVKSIGSDMDDLFEFDGVWLLVYHYVA